MATRTKPSNAIPFLSDDERVAHVWEMRLSGKSHEAIAVEMENRFPGAMPKGWGVNKVFEDCSTALNRVAYEYRESARDMVEIELGRFDKLLSSVWKQAESGDVRAVEAALAISRERRKMIGLDHPEKFQIDWRLELVNLLTSNQTTPQQIAEEFGDEVLIEVNQLLLERRANE